MLLNKRAACSRVSEHCKLCSGTFRPHCESVLTCAGGQFLGSQHGELQVTSVAELLAAGRALRVLPGEPTCRSPKPQLYFPGFWALKN